MGTVEKIYGQSVVFGLITCCYPYICFVISNQSCGKHKVWKLMGSADADQ